MRLESSAPPRSVATERTHRRLPLGLHTIDGLPLLIVSRAELEAMKARTGCCLLSDLAGARDLDYTEPDTEETTP
jgi:hypothetical protein